MNRKQELTGPLLLSVFGIASFGVAWPAGAQPYVVYVPRDDASTLQQVRQYQPEAFRAIVNGTPAIQAGAFNSQFNADTLAQQLRNGGLPAQVSYRGSTTPDVVEVLPPSTPSAVTAAPPPPPSTTTPFTQSTVPLTTTLPTGALAEAGQIPQFRYVTGVPVRGDATTALQQVRQYVPNAFVARSGRGSFVYAGAYNQRNGAEALAYYLRSQGLDARVLYF